MSLTRICDVGDCDLDAGFMVAAWSEDGTQLNETGDVCGSQHADEWVRTWLKDMADVVEVTDA
jgi:hypothetical protein